MLRYDLHSHSTASDGTLSPAELMRHAAAQGVDVIALTDHDGTAGVAEAMAAAREHGVILVPGVEISVTWGHQLLHIVGLGIDVTNAALQEGLARMQVFRAWRAEEMGRRLAKKGIDDAYEGARRFAGGAPVGRTHFARYLVEVARARDVQDAFKHYLRRGKPGYVPGQWAGLDEAVGWIRGAGGEAVIAHPGRYELSASRMRQLCEEFTACGGAGIEVISGSQPNGQADHWAMCAQRFGLRASAGSDYHGPGQSASQLGVLPPLPRGCVPIWSKWALLRPLATATV